MSNFLRTAATAVRGGLRSCAPWMGEIKKQWSKLKVDQSFAQRNVNRSFSGGERKRHRILRWNSSTKDREYSTKPTPGSMWMR